MTMSRKIHQTSIIEGEVSLGAKCIVDSFALLRGPINTGKNCFFGSRCCVHGPAEFGDDVFLGDMSLVGFPNQKQIVKFQKKKTKSPYLNSKLTIIGEGCIIRTGTSVYAGSKLGLHVRVGHNALIRENVSVGDYSVVGSGVIIDGHSKIGKKVSIQSGVYIPLKTMIEDHVFLGPNCLLTNDKYLMRTPYDLKGPIIKRGSSIGAGAIILPEIEIGEEAVVGAGAVVTKNVPAKAIVVGIPAQIKSYIPDSWEIPSK